MNTSRTRVKSPGWAAFDLRNKQKRVLQDEVDKDPYPPIASTLPAPRSFGNVPRKNDLPTRSFSSLLQPSMNFPSLTKNFEDNELTEFGYSEGNKVIQKNHDSDCKKLKELHGWADKNLIEDVMIAVDGNLNKASSLLKEMVPTTLEETRETKHYSRSDDVQFDKIKDKTVALDKTTEYAAEIAELSSAIEDALKFDQKESRDAGACSLKPLSNDVATNMKVILGHLKSIPVEPEWEEDDVYLSHRKNALQVMRTASQHSRAATNAFLRGDHYLAQQHSLKAQDEWLAGERLNAHAAREILRIRNSTNDVWKLDLHGLHKTEAIQALQEHLLKIETQVFMDRPVYSDKLKGKNSSASSSTPEFASSMQAEDRNKQKSTFRVKPRSLQVITGVGNHSRGQAALPAAVRSFFDENGYHYDETRPGVIMVWSKFRQR